MMGGSIIDTIRDDFSENSQHPIVMSQFEFPIVITCYDSLQNVYRSV